MCYSAVGRSFPRGPSCSGCSCCSGQRFLLERRGLASDSNLTFTLEVRHAAIECLDELTVVLDEAQLLEFVQKEIHARARRADHLRERFLGHLGNARTGLSCFP
jgi:hypothetical protein